MLRFSIFSLHLLILLSHCLPSSLQFFSHVYCSPLSLIARVPKSTSTHHLSRHPLSHGVNSVFSGLPSSALPPLHTTCDIIPPHNLRHNLRYLNSATSRQSFNENREPPAIRSTIRPIRFSGADTRIGHQDQNGVNAHDPPYNNKVLNKLAIGFVLGTGIFAQYGTKDGSDFRGSGGRSGERLGGNGHYASRYGSLHDESRMTQEEESGKAVLKDQSMFESLERVLLCECIERTEQKDKGGYVECLSTTTPVQKIDLKKNPASTKTQSEPASTNTQSISFESDEFPRQLYIEHGDNGFLPIHTHAEVQHHLVGRGRFVYVYNSPDSSRSSLCESNQQGYGDLNTGDEVCIQQYNGVYERADAETILKTLRAMESRENEGKNTNNIGMKITNNSENVKEQNEVSGEKCNEKDRDPKLSQDHDPKLDSISKLDSRARLAYVLLSENGCRVRQLYVDHGPDVYIPVRTCTEGQRYVLHEGRRFYVYNPYNSHNSEGYQRDERDDRAYYRECGGKYVLADADTIIETLQKLEAEEFDLKQKRLSKVSSSEGEEIRKGEKTLVSDGVVKSESGEKKILKRTMTVRTDILSLKRDLAHKNYQRRLETMIKKGTFVFHPSIDCIKISGKDVKMQDINLNGGYINGKAVNVREKLSGKGIDVEEQGGIEDIGGAGQEFKAGEIGGIERGSSEKISGTVSEEGFQKEE